MVLADRLQFSLFPAVAKTTSLCTSGAQKKKRPRLDGKPHLDPSLQVMLVLGARGAGKGQGSSEVAVSGDPACTPPL